MKNKILINILFLSAIIASFLAWYFTYLAINNQSSASWVAPILCFSVLAIICFLSAALIRDLKLITALILLSLLLSLVFAPDFWRSIDIGISCALLVLASIAIKKEMRAGVKISSRRAFRAGSFLIVIALALSIAAQYFFEVKKMDVAKQIPKFRTQKITSLVIPRFLAITNPELSNVDKNNITVDEFILNTQQKQIVNISQVTMTDADLDRVVDEQFGKNISPTQREIYKAEIQRKISAIDQSNTFGRDFVLEQGRRQLSDMAGMTLKGDERITDVLSRKIDSSIAEAIAPLATGGETFPILPASMAIILFLSVFSLGLFLSSIWIFFAGAIFKLLVKTGVVVIGKTMEEVEILE